MYSIKHISRQILFILLVLYSHTYHAFLMSNSSILKYLHWIAVSAPSVSTETKPNTDKNDTNEFFCFVKFSCCPRDSEIDNCSCTRLINKMISFIYLYHYLLFIKVYSTLIILLELFIKRGKKFHITRRWKSHV